jgi:hypothetical protein
MELAVDQMDIHVQPHPKDVVLNGVCAFNSSSGFFFFFFFLQGSDVLQGGAVIRRNIVVSRDLRWLFRCRVGSIPEAR